MTSIGSMKNEKSHILLLSCAFKNSGENLDDLGLIDIIDSSSASHETLFKNRLLLPTWPNAWLDIKSQLPYTTNLASFFFVMPFAFSVLVV